MAAKGLCRLLAAGCLGLSLVFPAYADNWQAPLVDEGLPSHLVAVDKHRQSFLFFERKSPLRLKYTFPCTTGQVPGDKQVINDKRTPEGIYFVEYKIASGLDFAEYGGVAYTLNYPNPVDRLRGKTGHGIWIHSKGFGIFPRDTRGCVAIGLQDIDTVGPSLVPGTAVVLAHAVDENNVPQRDDGTARYLRHRMQQWSDAWAARSEKMFDFYDGPAYSKATEDFGKFRQNKQRLFKMLSFIKIINRDIHVLQGPGYWVTWSEQFYTASNLSTEGVRRLYWQKDGKGEFRIVGMEWTPRDMGMLAEFKQGKLIAQALPVMSDGSEGPSRPALDMPESAADEKAAATAAGGEQERLLAADALVPRNQPTQITGEINWGSGSTLDTLRPDERVDESLVFVFGQRRVEIVALPSLLVARLRKQHIEVERRCIDDGRCSIEKREGASTDKLQHLIGKRLRAKRSRRNHHTALWDMSNLLAHHGDEVLFAHALLNEPGECITIDGKGSARRNGRLLGAREQIRTHAMQLLLEQAGS